MTILYAYGRRYELRICCRMRRPCRGVYSYILFLGYVPSGMLWLSCSLFLGCGVGYLWARTPLVVSCWYIIAVKECM
jgi:hypothetical protein